MVSLNALGGESAAGGFGGRYGRGEGKCVAVSVPLASGWVGDVGFNDNHL